MSDDTTAPKVEIVIVRRRGGDDTAAVKGGAWKIAYADFVTAMMAFFLVMWLINASNEATRAQVASYFNPIKLTDSSTGNRGLKERKENKTTQAGETQDPPAETVQSKAEAQKEAALLADPQKALEIIASEAAGHSAAPSADVGSGTAASSGMADPFDPRSWEAVPEHVRSEVTGPAAQPEKTPELKPAEQPAESKIEKTPVVPEAEQKPVTKIEESSPPIPEVEKSETNAREAQQIAGEIAAKLGTGLDDLPASIDVKVSSEGILISLTDKHVFGMFKTGSAEPEPRMLALVDAVAASLATHQGYIVVRGHTDSRPYKNKKYDNWQLSTARAHLAQYMLVRSGLDGKRIRRIEGMADREPRLPDDPQAPENRRIEILLGRESP